MRMDLKSMAVEMPEVRGHPNRAAFQGVLTMVDVPSQRSPSGAKGHLVVLTKKAAEAALSSLLGMGVDYAPSLDRHDVRRKVGVITRADIVGRNVELGGYLFAKDFPEIVEEIAKSDGSGRNTLRGVAAGEHHEMPAATGGHSRLRGEGSNFKSSLKMVAAQLLSLTEALCHRTYETRRIQSNLRVNIRAETQLATGATGLGMSYEVTGVQVADVRASVWRLDKVTFTGAAILRRDKAAYRDTWIELST